jgi:hypothetical protein
MLTNEERVLYLFGLGHHSSLWEALLAIRERSYNIDMKERREVETSSSMVLIIDKL